MKKKEWKTLLPSLVGLSCSLVPDVIGQMLARGQVIHRSELSLNMSDVSEVNSIVEILSLKVSWKNKMNESKLNPEALAQNHCRFYYQLTAGVGTPPSPKVSRTLLHILSTSTYDLDSQGTFAYTAWWFYYRSRQTTIFTSHYVGFKLQASE